MNARVRAIYMKLLLIVLQINYKLLNAARDKSATNYQVGRFDMELDVDPSSNRHRIMRLTSCPRHSHNERVRPTSLPDTHLRNTAASTVSHTFFSLSINLFIAFCVERIRLNIYFTDD